MLMLYCLAAVLLSLSTLHVHISLIPRPSHDFQYCVLEGLGQDISIVGVCNVETLERAWVQG